MLLKLRALGVVMPLRGGDFYTIYSETSAPMLFTSTLEATAESASRSSEVCLCFNTF